MRGKDGEKILDCSLRIPFTFLSSMLGSFSQGGFRNSFIVLSMVWRGIGLKSEHVLYKKWMFCTLLAVLPTGHKTNKSLSFSLNAEADDFTSTLLVFSIQCFNFCSAFLNLHFLSYLLIEPSAHAWLLFHAVLIINATFTSTSKVSLSGELTVTLSTSLISCCGELISVSSSFSCLIHQHLVQ